MDHAVREDPEHHGQKAQDPAPPRLRLGGAGLGAAGCLPGVTTPRSPRSVAGPAALAALAGPGADLHRTTIAAFSRALNCSAEARTVCASWCRRYGTGEPDHASTRLFAVHTWLAHVARQVAALSLPGAAARLCDQGAPLRTRLLALESGALLLEAGVVGFPGSDPFAWPVLDDRAWDVSSASLAALLCRLEESGIAAGSPGKAEDLFRALVQGSLPASARHAYGEHYTPRWLAAHVLDRIGWTPSDPLLDPTCGSGTFLLEALGRRLEPGPSPGATATDLLSGLWGLDLSHLAVLAARASIVVALSPWIRPESPVTLPVFQGDAVEAAPGAGDVPIPPVPFIAGNPPWVKWSQLPPEYARSIGHRCAEVGLSGGAGWVGGVEVDFSALVTFEAIRRWLCPGGRLGFLLPATLLSTEAAGAFRRFSPGSGPGCSSLDGGGFECRALGAEDISALRPFDGVSVGTVLLLLERSGTPASYPVPFVVWTGLRRRRSAAAAGPEGGACRRVHLLACPVPGTATGPWLRGTREKHRLFERLFDPGRARAYRARKGVTTDRNGVFFVRVRPSLEGGLVEIRNDPSVGRAAGLRAVEARVERDHVFPLLRGRGIRPFAARTDPDFHVLVPQRGMHGDPCLPSSSPATWRYLAHFEDELRRRGSYRRFQRGRPWWSLWSVGEYTFAPWKVVWREMAGSRFCAAWIGGAAVPGAGTDVVVVPDHKAYFVPLRTELEAAYLGTLLNAPMVARAVSAYAAQLSLGTSVMEYLAIPAWDPDDPAHAELAEAGLGLAARGSGLGAGDLAVLDGLSDRVLRTADRGRMPWK